MQSKVLIFALIIFGSLFAYTSAQCQPKQPMANFNPTLFKGKYYLVGLERAFIYQNKEAHCGTSEIKEATQKMFPYIVTYQDQNGSTQTITLSVENISPPGNFNITGGDGTPFQVVVLGAIQNKIHVLYSCNPQNNQMAVWIYYSPRVARIQEMDPETLQYVKKTLSDNNIPLNGVKDIDNSDCKT